MKTKICNKCKKEKSLNEFYKNKNCKFGVLNTCIICKKNIDKEYYKNNSETIIKKNKEYINNNLELVKIKQKEYYEKNKEKIIENQKKYNKIYVEKNKDLIKTKRLKNKNKKIQYEKNKRMNDLNYKIKSYYRTKISDSIKKRNGNKHFKVIDLIGCTIEELKHHLESQFTEGMSWDNYGKYGWHIDHIKPCASFDLKDPEEQKKCFHFSNLQPLWWIDNLRKNKFFKE